MLSDCSVAERHVRGTLSEFQLLKHMRALRLKNLRLLRLLMFFESCHPEEECGRCGPISGCQQPDQTSDPGRVASMLQGIGEIPCHEGLPEQHLARVPQVTMEIPVASITDDREHMIMRAICDERISLPCEALALVPDLFNQHEEFDRHSPRMFCQIASRKFKFTRHVTMASLRSYLHSQVLPIY